VEYRPWTWKIPDNSKEMSRTITRQDAFERVSGQAIYTRDVNLPGMLYAKILLSPHAHARIAGIDTSKAEALVGVRDILKYDDADIAFDNGNHPGFEVSRNYNILTLPRTSDFYQHPMGAVVVADSEEICDRALRLMKVEWEEQPFILEMEDSLKPDAPKIMPEVKRMNPKAKEPNTVLTDRVEIGNVEDGFLQADKVIEYTITRARNTTAGVEPIVCVNDVGNLFNPEGAAAQQYGGVVMGLGRSGTEEHYFCPRTGVALNYDLIGYHLGTMNDYPPAQCLINESHLGYAAYGSYGIGENVGASMSGITVSAIHNATGKWVLDYPTTPDRVLRALGKI
jgi:CO/xanthine dehydrogenase Mo-binding subunit